MTPSTQRPTVGRRRAAWAAGALLLGAVTVAFTPPIRTLMVPGTTYSFTTESAESDESFAVAGKTMMRQVGKVRVAGDKARIDFTEQKGPKTPGMNGDGYMLIHADGEVLYMVDTKKKEYVKMDPKAIGSMFSAISSMGGGMMKIEMSDASMSTRKLGAGEALLGHTTEKWEFTQGYTMSVKAFGFGSTTRNETTAVMWAAPGLNSREMMNPFIDVARSMTAMFEGNKELEKIITKPMNQLPKSAMLKMESKTKTTSDKGKAQYSVSTMEVTEWSKGDVSASDLEVPKGYKMIEMPDMAALADSMKASGLDTLDLKASMKNAGYSDEDIAGAIKQAAIQGATEQAKEEARNAGKNAVKAGIGGLFKKKPF